MATLATHFGINWTCRHTWRRSSYNTMWCLIGCSIGDFGTIAFFQYSGIPWPTLYIMTLAIINGLLTSIILETFILSRQMEFDADSYSVRAVGPKVFASSMKTIVLADLAHTGAKTPGLRSIGGLQHLHIEGPEHSGMK